MTAEQAGKYFDKYDTNKSGEIDPIEWSLMIPIEEVPKMVSKCKKAGPVKSTALSPDELVAMKNMLSRCDNICAYAAELGVRLMIDAEHFHMQPAIDQAVLTMQLKYNKTYPAVYNTYQVRSPPPPAAGRCTEFRVSQAYLRRTPGKLREDLERCKREDIHFGDRTPRRRDARRRAAQPTDPWQAASWCAGLTWSTSGSAPPGSASPTRSSPTSRRSPVPRLHPAASRAHPRPAS